MNKIQDAIKEINRVQLEIGSLETQKHRLTHYASDIQGQLNTMREDFEKTYGTSNINIEDGTIDYEKNE